MNYIFVKERVCTYAREKMEEDRERDRSAVVKETNAEFFE